MPRYHFPVIVGVRVFDSEGLTLPDARSAKHYARLRYHRDRHLLATGASWISDCGAGHMEAGGARS
jgi:hypothetical protein